MHRLKRAYSVTLNEELIGLVVCREFEGWMLYEDQNITKTLIHEFVTAMARNMGFETEEDFYKTIPDYSSKIHVPVYKFDLFGVVRYGLSAYSWDYPEVKPILRMSFVPMFVFDKDPREFDLKYIYSASGSGGFTCMFLLQPTMSEYESAARYIPDSIRWTCTGTTQAEDRKVSGMGWLTRMFG